MLFVANPPLLHVACPQTNSAYLRRVLRKAAPTREIVAPDSPAWTIEDREEYRDVRDTPQLLRFGAVRDPWSWYAAVFGAVVRARRPEALQALHAWSGGTMRFRDFVYGATHPETRLYTPHPLGILWGADGSRGWEGLKASTLGLCSFSYLYHYGRKRAWQRPTQRPDFAVDVLIDAARIDEALRSILGDRLFPSVSPRRETGEEDRARAVLAGSYDVEMTRWVAEADGPACRLMGFETPFFPSTGPVLVPVRAAGARRRGPGTRLTREMSWNMQRARVRHGLRPSARLDV